ncbi:MAG: DUF4391 domain-containing protein [Ferrovum myxofaciens]|uniref:DUF4391 domain-containing protein n=1 Tax=Ferrovum myxofaciens TaxID=416213 RepID=UPI002357E82E|nr:DUF4391 domain-containing protein [Ferrovum myxofaciens]QKE40028.1 MAG: DUF4391 domain-containing protein [Ferrovum myxofaciens]
MTAQDIVLALGLPDGCRLDQRVPKKLLVENGAPTAADKRDINEGIEEIQWLATLKPSTIGVAEFRDETREYLEIAVLHIILRENAKIARIAELTHRAVPYPLVLLLTMNDALTISMVHIRWAQNETGKVVLDGEPVAATLNWQSVTPDIFQAFLQALSIIRQPRTNLKVLYHGWLDTLVAFQAVQITGVFAQGKTGEQLVARRKSLLACRELEQQIAALRAAATKEKQLARQVELNLELKRVQSELAAAKERL